MAEFETKDSGERAVFESGMQRDTEDGKARFDLMLPLGVPYEEQMITRLAELYGRGAVKYEDRNWERADSEVEMARMKSSAFRHFMQWMNGEVDEDHAAGTMFNIIAFETTKYKVENSGDSFNRVSNISFDDEDDLDFPPGGRPYVPIDVPEPEEALHSPRGLAVGDRAEVLVDAEQLISEEVPIFPSVANLMDMINNRVFNRSLTQAAEAVALRHPPAVDVASMQVRLEDLLIGPDLLHKRSPIDWSGRSGG